MYTKRTYKFLALFKWTRFDSFRFLVIILVWVAAYVFLELTWLKIPWTPIALIGTAVAFLIGFQNNAAYDRIWEARKIWGGIVNSSRTLGMYLQDMITNEYAKNPVEENVLSEEIKTITYRHIAWMTALRYAMRQPKPWETFTDTKTNREWQLYIPEHEMDLKEALAPYLSDIDLTDASEKDNKQTAILYQQSHHLKKLKEEGVLWEFSFLQLEGVLEELFALQGKSERIKNFPYPRQYATINHYFMWLLLLLLPLALVPQFAEIGKETIEIHPVLGNWFVWFSVPVYVALGWIFHTMERIGRTGENPFEGTANDVPISTIARGIEIDLRQNLGESKEDIPDQFSAANDVQY